MSERRGLSAQWSALCACAGLTLPCAILLSCAVQVAPSGGPEDTKRPHVSATVPAADSAGVQVSSEIAIEFGESMSRPRVERLLSFSPPVAIGGVRWSGNTIVIRPAQPLHADTTYVVTLKAGYRDHHNVAATDPYSFAFATSARIDSGSIGGTVLFRRKPTANAVVRCFVLPLDTGFVAAAALPGRETRTGSDGVYRVRYLPTHSNQFVLWAFEDTNHNGAFDAAQEHGAMYADTILLDPGSHVTDDVRIAIVDPAEPAVVRGRVVNESGIDSLLAAVTLLRPGESSPLRYYARCDDRGGWEMKSVRAGTYAVSAFVDLRPDSTCGSYPCRSDSSNGCAEPCASAIDSVVVAPGSVVVVPPLRIEHSDGGR